MTTSFDPTTMATNLATAYTQSAQSLITAQSKAAQATTTGLTKLQSALTAFNTALSGLSSSTGKTLTQYSATASDASVLSATATGKAQATSTPLFVEQLATTHQVAFQDLPAVPAGPGSMSVQLANGSGFNVDLASADSDGDGTLSQSEIARAINTAANGQATAMVVTVGGATQLLLTSGVSGAGGKITLDTTGLSGPLKTALDDTTKRKDLVGAQDAVVWLGAQGSGVRLQQSTNTLTAIEGVTVTLKKAQASGDAPTTLTVSRDDSATAGKLQTFVDAYNTLTKTLGDLTAVGSGTTTTGAFASDAGVRALRDRLSGLLRADYGGSNLRTLGVNIDRYGQLSLDSAKLTKALSAKPTALDDVLGSAALSAPSGLLGAFDKAVDVWTDSGTGQIKSRQATVTAQQKSLTDRQTRLDSQYTQAYNRYLQQFTALQNLQSQLSGTGSLFDSISASAS
ncbi:flagellar filament capping protein FliD [Roseateles terrae]|uniref:Flagellar hook-associated protein 2 n=1 Tax=Roseateles terrae TaxID=431060 RepID=A0ABR6GSK7_9BURK|nr:flagellar filament capping protein FliD [Roseateles terrae]MBB3194128.1 flagellar hook-associated protein 2 [Roseateles terrae]OWQ88311.1 lateral flagellar hook-associated protein 2 [Roseateles terrae]